MTIRLLNHFVLNKLPFVEEKEENSRKSLYKRKVKQDFWWIYISFFFSKGLMFSVTQCHKNQNEDVFFQKKKKNLLWTLISKDALYDLSLHALLWMCWLSSYYNNAVLFWYFYFTALKEACYFKILFLSCSFWFVEWCKLHLSYKAIRFVKVWIVLYMLVQGTSINLSTCCILYVQVLWSLSASIHHEYWQPADPAICVWLKFKHRRILC